MKNLSKNSKWVRLSGAVSADVDGAMVGLGEIDTQGYSGCMVVFQVGTIATDGVITTRLKNSATSASYGSGTVDRIGSDLANSADTDDNKFIVHDVYRPERRYVKPYYQRTVGNVTIEAVFAVLYGAERAPVASADVEASQVLNNPVPSAN